MKYKFLILLLCLSSIVSAQIDMDQLRKDAEKEAEFDRLLEKHRKRNQIVYKAGPIYSGKTHKAVKIGNQIWTSENLNIDVFRNGDKILFVSNGKELQEANSKKKAAWSYYKFDPKYKYLGRFYNGYAVVDKRGIAPKGWKVPSWKDWVEFYKSMENKIGKKWTKCKFNDDSMPLNGPEDDGFNGISIAIKVGKNKNPELGRAMWWSSSKYLKENTLSAMILESEYYGRDVRTKNLSRGIFELNEMSNIRLIKE